MLLAGAAGGAPPAAASAPAAAPNCLEGRWYCRAAASLDAARRAERRARARRPLFPVRGRHDLGRGPGTRFGGGRGHKGQDLFAPCGTPVAAALGGKVLDARFEGAAGNYVVLSVAGGGSHVYMHLRHRPRLRRGERVPRGERLGAVGDTGDAQGCHLHFERWTSPGWFRGGRPVDPLPALRRWDATS